MNWSTLSIRKLGTYLFKMPRNVEVKAKVGDIEGLILKAKNLCKCDGTIIEQDDTFFKTETGRLKLRIFKVIWRNILLLASLV